MNHLRADIAVAGGGSAGLAAAITAARSGVHVVLIEGSNRLGGMASRALVHSICGLYLLRSGTHEELQYANHGFPMEFSEALLRMGGARGPVRMGRLDVVMHQPEAFAQLAEKSVKEFPNLDLSFGTKVTEVQSDGAGLIGGLKLLCGGSSSLLEVSAVVDATGDAEVAYLAGASFERSPLERLQRPAYIFLLKGVAASLLSEDGRMLIARAISYAVTRGQLGQGALGAAFRTAVLPEDAWVTIDLQARGFDPNQGSAGSALLTEGRALAIELLEFLKSGISGFRNASIAAFPESLGVRESRRINGLYQLSGKDLFEGRRFEDEVAMASWPIELRETAKGPRFRFPEENRPCGIPLRSLKSRDFNNLFVAGRCLSASHEAQAAIRVIGTCLATGEAAGRAAAESCF